MKILELKLIQTKSPNVISRIDIVFEEFTLRGFKLLKDPRTNKDYILPPSYYTPNGWRPLFRTNTPEEWDNISIQVLRLYNEILMKESLDNK